MGEVKRKHASIYHGTGVKPHAVIIPCTEPDATCENQDPITSGCADLTVGGAKMANAGAIAVGPASNPVVIARVYQTGP